MKPSHAVRKNHHEPKDHGWCKLDLKIPQKTEYRSQGLYDAALAILQNIQNGEFPWNFAALLPNLEWNSASLTNGTSYSFELSPGLLKVVEFCWIVQVFRRFFLVNITNWLSCKWPAAAGPPDHVHKELFQQTYAWLSCGTSALVHMEGFNPWAAQETSCISNEMLVNCC